MRPRFLNVSKDENGFWLATLRIGRHIVNVPVVAVTYADAEDEGRRLVFFLSVFYET